NSRQSRAASTNTELPNLVRQGRTASVRQSQQLNNTPRRAQTSRSSNENSNRSNIDRVIRKLQGNGLDVQVINGRTQARQYSQQSRARRGANTAGRSNSNASSKSDSGNTAAKEYRLSNNYNNSSSTRNSSSNVRSNSSSSYRAPARVSSGGRSSSSGRSSSGRSSGRRQ
ncbi:MAG: hypothetical protein ABF277_00005, partial [Candidatus Arcticimaribacter sp.]